MKKDGFELIRQQHILNHISSSDKIDEMKIIHVNGEHVSSIKKTNNIKEAMKKMEEHVFLCFDIHPSIPLAFLLN